MMAAEGEGVLMLAEIAIRRAFAYGTPKPAPTPGKKTVKKYRIIR
jgi:hypothetical protein